MASKHFIHDPSQLVAWALRSLPLTNPSLVLDQDEKVVRFIPPPDARPSVSIISGGGAGHEPAFSAYVGQGLLSAAVSGNIFASPNSSQILSAIEQVNPSRGILVTVMDYTGDVLNFGVALERARARRPDLDIEMLIIGDDVGVPRSRAGKVGRRGVAGTCLVHKITGAAAAQGYELSQVLKLGEDICANLASIGVSLDRVHVPGRTKTVDTEQILQDDEVELGMGIHNEPGSGRRSGYDCELSVLVKEMLDQLIRPTVGEGAFVSNMSGEAVLLVNNLGGLSPLELGAVTTEVFDQLLENHRIKTPRVYSGTFMTSLNGPGFSISLLFLPPEQSALILDLLDSPTQARGWTAPCDSRSWQPLKDDAKTASIPTRSESVGSRTTRYDCDMNIVMMRLAAGLRAVIAAEPEVTRYDTIVGDGDCGTTLKRGAEELMKMCANPPQDVEALLQQVVSGVEKSMDGTSGALYSIFLNAFQAYVSSTCEKTIQVDRNFWVSAMEHATHALTRYTPATKGDRTMMDVLLPFQEALSAGRCLREAADEAAAEADRTRNFTAKLGRAVYVGGQESWVGIIPDPGAWGLSKFFLGLAMGPL